MVAAGSVDGPLAYSDSFVENAVTGITLAVTQVDATINVTYTNLTDISGQMSYVITNLF
jgi:hypothetical protein